MAKTNKPDSSALGTVLRSFSSRHIGLNEKEKKEMLNNLGYSDFDAFIKNIIPHDILNDASLKLEEEISEEQALAKLKILASDNKLYHSFIGQGYYNSFTPTVILRNVFENPGWYTSYTPYQPEISQGRLEALIN